MSSLRNPRVDELLATLHAVPEEAREYTFTDDAATMQFGLDGEALQRLVAEGLPCATVDGERRYDSADLHYVGLRLGVATVYLWTIRAWARALVRFAEQPATSVRFSYLTQLPDGSPAVDGTVRVPGGERVAVRFEHNTAAVQLEAQLRADWPALGEDVAELLRDVAAYEFYGLPTWLREQPDRVRELRMGECEATTRVLLENCRAAGVEARPAHGLLVALPYSLPHAWTEVRVEGTWVPVDPLIVATLWRFAGLDRDAWPLTRSTGAMLVRLGEAFEPLATTGETPVHTTILTSVVG
jgi:transglutaminase-like putative cysteine protease